MHSAHNRSEYNRFVAILSNPQTPMEWDFAIRNPYSRISIIYQQILKENIAEEKRQEILLERWIEYQKERREGEIAQGIKDEIAACILTEQRIWAPKETSETYTEDKIIEKSLAELIKYSMELSTKIADFKTETDALHSYIEEAHKKIINADKKVDDTQREIVRTIKDDIINERIPVFDTDGNEMSMEEIENVFDRIPPAASLGRVYQSRHEADPEFFEKKFIPQVQAQEHNMVQQLMGLCEMCQHHNEDNIAKAMLKHIKLNRELNKKWNEVAKENVTKLSNNISKLRDGFVEVDQNKMKLTQIEKVQHQLENSLEETKRLINHKKQITPPSPLSNE